MLKLYSDKIEKVHELTTRERSELVTIINWLNTNDILEWMDSKEVSIDCLYMYIRVKQQKMKIFWNGLMHIILIFCIFV